MNSKELFAKAQAALNEAQALQAKLGEGASPEAVKAIEGKLGEYDQWKAQASMAKRIEEGQAEYNAPASPTANFEGFRPAGQDEGNLPVDEKAWREYSIKTPYGERKMRYFVPVAVEQKGYSTAFEAYLRKGFDAVGPNDRKTLSMGTDNAGGFTVPEDFQAELLKKVATAATIRQFARIVPTSRDAAKWARVNYTTDNKYTSGARLTWTGEQPASASTHRVTDAVFGVVNIPVHTAMASMPMSNDLLEDSAFDLVGVGSDLLAEAFVLGENDAFINGSGAARPKGILTDVASTENINGPKYVISGTNGAISTGADAWSGKRLVDVYYDLPAQYRRNAVWLMNSSIAAAAENLVDNNKRPVLKELNTASVAMGEPTTIKGRPVYIDEFVPDAATDSYSIIFGDLSGYIIVDRVGFSIQRLTDSAYSELNLTGLLARKRVGGQLAQPERVRVMKLGTS